MRRGYEFDDHDPYVPTCAACAEIFEEWTLHEDGVCCGCFRPVCPDCAIDVSYDVPVLNGPGLLNGSPGRFVEFVRTVRYICPDCMLEAKTPE